MTLPESQGEPFDVSGFAITANRVSKFRGASSFEFGRDGLPLNRPAELRERGLSHCGRMTFRLTGLCASVCAEVSEQKSVTCPAYAGVDVRPNWKEQTAAGEPDREGVAVKIR